MTAHHHLHACALEVSCDARARGRRELHRVTGCLHLGLARDHARKTERELGACAERCDHVQSAEHGAQCSRRGYHGTVYDTQLGACQLNCTTVVQLWLGAVQ